ncbi:MAG: Uncharacterized protein JWM31_2758, partial [Solirubrobacterales bacterium]|nr:Uncharacterized protein [Solirubrobacterales bacterium]
SGTLLVGLLPPADGPRPGASVDEMRALVAGGVVFRIAVATPLGRWQPIGELTLDEVLPADAGDVDFDPLQYTGGGLTPAPAWLQTVRSEAYRLSRRGRHAPQEPRLEPEPDRA